eukprot:8880652-Alexandrium_andersonii.AAC.1
MVHGARVWILWCRRTHAGCTRRWHGKSAASVLQQPFDNSQELWGRPIRPWSSRGPANCLDDALELGPGDDLRTLAQRPPALDGTVQ